MYRVGDKWHAMELVSIEDKDINEYEMDADGRQYVAASYPQRTVTIQCACGSKPIEAPYRTFRKRDYRDCGCGRSWSGVMVVTSFGLSQGMKEHLDRFAMHKGITASQVIVEALMQYFSANKDESNNGK